MHRLSIGHIDDTHFFTLSQVYEDLLLKTGEKNGAITRTRPSSRT
ncbi:hypothetical protein [Thiocapsa sp.]|nr:hypothetical protein [Thiocapsa sp.]